MYLYNPDWVRIGSIRITGGSMMDVVEQIEDVWDRVIPEYPMQGRFLDDTFNDIYNILKYMNAALAGFAFIALSLALIGLFGVFDGPDGLSAWLEQHPEMLARLKDELAAFVARAS